MPFVRRTWQNNPPSSSTPVSADELNRIEAGIDLAHLKVSRGYLPNNADLNDYTESDQTGVYYIDSNRGFDNFPGPTRSPNQGAIFIVHLPSDSGNLGGMQEVVWGENRWWREAQNRNNRTWYDWKEIGSSSGAKGYIPNGADLNDYTAASDSGTWYLDSSRTFVNFPGTRNSPTQGAIFIVSHPLDTGQNGGLQEVIFGEERWWREARSRPNNTWYEWQRVPLWGDLPDIDNSEIVQSATVKRIITSANPGVPLEDGDLLIVWEG